MNKLSVPFKIKDVFHGFAESNGILRLEDDVLAIEFQTKDNLVGAIQSEVKNIRLSVCDIESVDFRKSILGNSLTIRLSTMELSHQVPNQESGEITVSIDRRNVEAALDFVSRVKLEVADQRLRDVNI
ncbi:MAG: hypothetical protein AAFX93_07930 [Verrucomicrobiota bacterium]